MSEQAEMALNFTGERFIPGMSPDQLAAEHISRYRFSSKFAKNRTILDLGCGTGYGSLLLSQTAKRVVGVDVDLETIRYANTHYHTAGLIFSQMDCRSLGFGNASFDLIVSFETIEHITEHEQMLSEVNRVLTREGLFIISTPEKTRYNARRKRPNPYHLRELSEAEFSDLLESRFPCVEILWQNVDPLAWEVRQIHEYLRSLEKRIDQIEQHPFRFLFKRFLPNILKRALLRVSGIKPRGPKATFQIPFFPLRPEHFTFDAEAAPEAQYMLAVCSYKPILNNAHN